MKSKTAEILQATLGTVLFLFLILPLFLVWIPYIILSEPNYNYLFDIGVIRHLGLIPIVTGVVIYLWCSYNFVFFGKGTPIHFTLTKKLVVTGLYRFVRNPMYIGALLIVIGEALYFQSLILIIYAMISFGFLHIFLRFFEEPYLDDKFGDSYVRYKRSVRRWLPGITPYRDQDTGPSKLG
jgi:protein-S-isoprenylcysteine O-methyltransferase Ste14